MRIAETVYHNQREKDQIDHSKIIRKVLQLNDWEAGLKLGVEKDIERATMVGELALIETDLKDLSDVGAGAGL